jgi:Fe-S cluster assembly protein SufB
MKYPCTILNGDNASAKCISIATAHKNVIQDSGAKMIHIGKKTRSSIISKSIAHNGGNASFRCKVVIDKKASESYCEVKCDSLILDNISKSDTFPTEKISNNTSFIKHEAKTSYFDKEKEFYLLSKGIDNKNVKHLLSLGFIEEFNNELPLEYSVELNRLIKNELEY